MFKALLGAAAALTLFAVAPAEARHHDNRDRGHHYGQDRGHGHGYGNDRGRHNQWRHHNRGRYYHHGRYYQSRYRHNNVWMYR